MSYQVSFEEKSRCPVFFSRYLNFCFYKDIGTRCSRTDDIASFFNHQRLADDIIKTKFLNRNTKLHAAGFSRLHCFFSAKCKQLFQWFFYPGCRCNTVYLHHFIRNHSSGIRYLKHCFQRHLCQQSVETFFHRQ